MKNPSLALHLHRARRYFAHVFHTIPYRIEMAITPGFKAFVIEQLEHAASITAKSMFGGVGLYADGFFFALIDDDRLYFKVDDTNRATFEEAGMGPFRPYGDERAMKYYEVPVEILEDVDALKQWSAGAIAVAQRAKRRR
jgi:DNA transformation protein